MIHFNTFCLNYFSSPEHECAQGELLSYRVVCRPSLSDVVVVNNFFKRHLLPNRLANFNQTSQ